MNIYPEHNWIPWQFGKIQKFFWEDESNVKELLKWISGLIALFPFVTLENLKIKKPEDWYNISLNQLYSLGCKTAIERNGGLFNLLSKFYPEHPWDSEKLKTSGSFELCLIARENATCSL